MVAQGPLEAFVMVRIHVGQPFFDPEIFVPKGPLKNYLSMQSGKIGHLSPITLFSQGGEGINPKS
jgi:hypothetical protein